MMQYYSKKQLKVNKSANPSNYLKKINRTKIPQRYITPQVRNSKYNNAYRK